MTHPITTTLGLSAGSGMVHCALVTVDDHDRTTVDSRVIDIDPTDRLDSPGRLNSAVDLMLRRAAEADVSVTAIGVAARGGAIPTGGVGARRQVHVVDDPLAVARALAQSGTVAAHPHVIVVDAGDSGTSIYALDTAAGATTTPVRSTALAGTTIDSDLAARVSESVRGLGSLRRAELRSACRTAKEELAVEKSATVVVGDHRVVVTGSMVEDLVVDGVAAVVHVIGEMRSANTLLADSPIVLVGGLATMGCVRAAFERELGEAPLVPRAPESIGAVGAALAARPQADAPVALEFIGGRRPRDLLSMLLPAAVGAVLVAGLLAATMVGVQVHGASAVDDDLPRAGSAVSTTASARPVNSATTTRTPGPDITAPTSPTDTADVPSPTARPWATTQLPFTQAPDVSTSTITAPTPSSPGSSQPTTPSTRAQEPEPSSPETSSPETSSPETSSAETSTPETSSADTPDPATSNTTTSGPETSSTDTSNATRSNPATSSPATPSAGPSSPSTTRSSRAVRSSSAAASSSAAPSSSTPVSTETVPPSR